MWCNWTCPGPPYDRANDGSWAGEDMNNETQRRSWSKRELNTSIQTLSACSHACAGSYWPTGVGLGSNSVGRVMHGSRQRCNSQHACHGTCSWCKVQYHMGNTLPLSNLSFELLRIHSDTRGRSLTQERKCSLKGPGTFNSKRVQGGSV